MPRPTPMLARDGTEALLDDDRFLFEPKLDGIRVLMFIRNGRVELRSRSDRDTTDAYPELHAKGLPDGILDGEVVLYDEKGNPDFGALLARHQRKAPPLRSRPVSFAVFDALEREGEDLTSRPIEERKAALSEMLGAPPPRIEQTLMTGHGRRLFDLMKDRGLEGVIAKRRGSVYQPGIRSADWRKVKVFVSADVLITGFRADRRALSSIEVGAFDDRGEIVPLGRVGTGFSESAARILRSALDGIRTGEEVATPAGVIVRVEPRLVAEVRYLHRTRDGSLRHASFLRIRADKPPTEVRLDDLTL